MSAPARTIATFAAIVTLAAARGAHAQEVPAPTKGVSLDVWVAGMVDRSVTNADTGAPYHGTIGLLGITALGNVGAFGFGVNVDGTPNIFGDGRLSVGGLAGWQPTRGREHYQILAEGGGHRFSEVGGGLFSNQLGDPDHWLPYVGARFGTSVVIPANSGFEIGIWLFARADLGEANVTTQSGGFLGGETTTTNYRLGGFQTGLAMRIGARVQRRAATSNRGPIEL